MRLCVNIIHRLIELRTGILRRTIRPEEQECGLIQREIYQAYITVNYKKMHLGCFDSYAEAVEARIEAEHKYYDPLIAAIEEEFS